MKCSCRYCNGRADPKFLPRYELCEYCYDECAPVLNWFVDLLAILFGRNKMLDHNKARGKFYRGGS